MDEEASYLLATTLLLIMLIGLLFIVKSVMVGDRSYNLVDTTYNYSVSVNLSKEVCEMNKRILVKENEEYSKWPDRLQCVKQGGK